MARWTEIARGLARYRARFDDALYRTIYTWQYYARGLGWVDTLDAAQGSWTSAERAAVRDAVDTLDRDAA